MMENCDQRTFQHSIPIDILDDLLTRFLICVPESATENLIRICFQIELAHWFYLDFYVGNDSRLKGCTMHEFAAHVFEHIPKLQSQRHKLNEIIAEWKTYKQCVPTYGAVMLSEGMTHVLLVQSYWAKMSWGFPKGKVNEEEDPAHCAIREVLEETGFDITNYIDPNEYWESVTNEQLVRLYIVQNIPMDTKFQPRTRNEIKSCEWFPVSDLPNHKKDTTPKVKMGLSANSFFMVMPFVKRLKAFCNGGVPKKPRLKSVSISEGDFGAGASSSKGKLRAVKKAPEVDTSGARFKDSDNKRNSPHFATAERDGNKGEKVTKRKHSSSARKELFVTEFNAPSWMNFKFDREALMNF